eukprot:5027285-Pleurochrysis_carterae.AAC.1
MCHHHTLVAVRDTGIPGLGRGVYARKDIPANTRIANYTLGTEAMSAQQFRRKYATTRPTH